MAGHLIPMASASTLISVSSIRDWVIPQILCEMEQVVIVGAPQGQKMVLCLLGLTGLSDNVLQVVVNRVQCSFGLLKIFVVRWLWVHNCWVEMWRCVICQFSSRMKAATPEHSARIMYWYYLYCTIMHRCLIGSICLWKQLDMKLLCNAIRHGQTLQLVVDMYGLVRSKNVTVH